MRLMAQTLTRACVLGFAMGFDELCVPEFFVKPWWRGFPLPLFGHRAGRQGTSMIRDPDHAPRSSWRGLRGAQICALPNYSGAPAIATGTSVPVLGAGFAQVTVPRTLAPWARAWDSVMVSFSWSLGALRASFQVATLLTTP